MAADARRRRHWRDSCTGVSIIHEDILNDGRAITIIILEDFLYGDFDFEHWTN